MSHSPLLKFNFTYDDSFGVPLIPVTFFHKNGTRAQLLNNAILDSGAYEITIPKELADLLGLVLRPRSNPVHTAGAKKKKTKRKKDVEKLAQQSKLTKEDLDAFNKKIKASATKRFLS